MILIHQQLLANIMSSWSILMTYPWLNWHCVLKNQICISNINSSLNFERSTSAIFKTSRSLLSLFQAWSTRIRLSTWTATKSGQSWPSTRWPSRTSGRTGATRKVRGVRTRDTSSCTVSHFIRSQTLFNHLTTTVLYEKKDEIRFSFSSDWHTFKKKHWFKELLFHRHDCYSTTLI
jgi:hypothetical protein